MARLLTLNPIVAIRSFLNTLTTNQLYSTLASNRYIPPKSLFKGALITALKGSSFRPSSDEDRKKENAFVTGTGTFFETVGANAFKTLNYPYAAVLFLRRRACLRIDARKTGEKSTLGQMLGKGAISVVVLPIELPLLSLALASDIVAGALTSPFWLAKRLQKKGKKVDPFDPSNLSDLDDTERHSVETDYTNDSHVSHQSSYGRLSMCSHNKRSLSTDSRGTLSDNGEDSDSVDHHGAEPEELKGLFYSATFNNAQGKEEESTVVNESNTTHLKHSQNPTNS